MDTTNIWEWWGRPQRPLDELPEGHIFMPIIVSNSPIASAKSTITRTLDGKEQVAPMIDGMGYKFDLDKSKYRLRVPKDEETEERVVVHIEPISGEQ